jgi:hypothetical protein
MHPFYIKFIRCISNSSVVFRIHPLYLTCIRCTSHPSIVFLNKESAVARGQAQRDALSRQIKEFLVFEGDVPGANIGDAKSFGSNLQGGEDLEHHAPSNTDFLPPGFQLMLSVRLETKAAVTKLELAVGFDRLFIGDRNGVVSALKLSGGTCTSLNKVVSLTFHPLYLKFICCIISNSSVVNHNSSRFTSHPSDVFHIHPSYLTSIRCTSNPPVVSHIHMLCSAFIR